MSRARTLRLAAGVEGWLSDDQAERLWNAASRVAPGGRIVEIGSFRGRSTIVLARAAGPSVELIAIDPHAGSDRGPQEIAPDSARGDTDFARFHENLEAAGIDGRVRHLRLFSTDALAHVDGPIDLLYIDGAHRYRPALGDITAWGARLAPGGALLIHDAFSSIGVTLAILTRLLVSRDFAYRGRSRSLAEYRRAGAGAALAGAAPAQTGYAGAALSAARQLAQLPWFARNVAIKAAVLARRPELARRLGLPDGDRWPY